MASKESVVQKRLINAIMDRWPDAYVRKIAQSLYSHGGVPDILACLDGNFIAIEVKTNKGKLSKLQALDIKLIEQAGGLALVCYGEGDFGYVLSLMEATCRINSSEDSHISTR